MTTSAAPNAKEKPTNIWLACIAVPIPLLIAVAVIQFGIRLEFNTEADASSYPLLITNMVSALIGIVAALCVLLLPVWIIQFSKAKKANLANGYGLDKTTAVGLAIFAGFWTWLYTFERDKGRFWLGLAVSVLSVGWLVPLVWLWAIFDSSRKPAAFYRNYGA